MKPKDLEVVRPVWQHVCALCGNIMSIRTCGHGPALLRSMKKITKQSNNKQLDKHSIQTHHRNTLTKSVLPQSWPVLAKLGVVLDVLGAVLAKSQGATLDDLQRK